MDGLLLTYYFEICLAKLTAINEPYVRKCEITKNMNMSKQFSNNLQIIYHASYESVDDAKKGTVNVDLQSLMCDWKVWTGCA